MQGFRRLIGGLMTMLVLAGGMNAAAASPDAVIELYTSQGCSSCPPADKLAAELNNSGDLVVLTFPVDYWDYLGWKDTLARPDNTERQYAYSRILGHSGVYTPQVVVNGREHVVGSDERAIGIAVKRQKNRFGGLPVPVSVATEGDILKVTVGAADAAAIERIGGGMATLWLVLFQHSREVPIGRGENRGRTVVYTNVVRHMQPIGMWKGAAKQLDLPKDEILKNADVGCAVLVQLDVSGHPGPILGAAQLTIPGQ